MCKHINMYICVCVCGCACACMRECVCWLQCIAASEVQFVAECFSVPAQHRHYQKSYYNTTPRPATHCNTLQHTATHCNILQHTATHCNALQHTATNCNTPAQRRRYQTSMCEQSQIVRSGICSAGCCRMLRCVVVCGSASSHGQFEVASVLQCVAVCCSVLRCDAVCCSVLQYFAVCCSVLQCVTVRAALQGVAV